MDGKYTRLKLKMLLLVVLGTLIAGGVGIFLLEVVVDGVLQDPFARFFLWAATTLFGQSPEGAAELYQRYIRNNKQEILTLGTMLLASRNKKIVGEDYKHPTILIVLGVCVVLLTGFSGIKALPGILKMFG